MARNPALEDALLQADIDELRRKYEKEREERTPEPIDLNGGEAPESAGTIATADDLVAVYSTQDGVVSVINVGSVAAKLKRDDNGVRWFSLVPENPEWKYKTDKVTGFPVKQNDVQMLCYLHPDHPHRAKIDQMGLSGKFCSKSNIPGDFQVRMHMLRRHKVEWDTIEAAERRDREDRQLGASEATMQAILELLKRQSGGTE